MVKNKFYILDIKEKKGKSINDDRMIIENNDGTIGNNEIV
jgi:hypothetical protein